MSKEVEDEAELQRLQAEGKEAADFLSTYIVQASMNEKGNYGNAFSILHFEESLYYASERTDKKKKTKCPLPSNLADQSSKKLIHLAFQLRCLIVKIYSDDSIIIWLF